VISIFDEDHLYHPEDDHLAGFGVERRKLHCQLAFTSVNEVWTRSTKGRWFGQHPQPNVNRLGKSPGSW
jgi:hypothetical protein